MRSFYRNLGGLSHLGFARGRQTRGYIVGKGRRSRDVEKGDTSQIVSLVAVSPVMRSSLPNLGNFNQRCRDISIAQRDKSKSRYKR